MKNQLITFVTSLVLSFSLFAASMPGEAMKVDVNTATLEQLDDGLVDVGEKTAMKIIEYRKSNGAFKSLDDLDKVGGIGSKTLEKNKDRIVFK